MNRSMRWTLSVMGCAIAAVLTAVLTAVLAAWAARPAKAAARVEQAPVTYRVYAIRYASIPFRVAGLIAGADTSRRLNLAMMVWLLQGSDGHDILVDAGFHRADMVRRYHPTDYLPPDSTVMRAGVAPDQIRDLIVSHVHWDHLDGIDLFPAARIWIQREEFDHHLDSAGTVKDRMIDAGDAKVLAQIAREGRVELIDGDAKEIMPGITVYTGGKHTFASQYVGVRTKEGTVVIASDNMYLYENLSTHRPIAQTLDSLSNLRAQARMTTIAASPSLIVPGHDPEVFVRFPKPGNGVALIAP